MSEPRGRRRPRDEGLFGLIQEQVKEVVKARLEEHAVRVAERAARLEEHAARVQERAAEFSDRAAAGAGGERFGGDSATRARLLGAAMRLFARDGFRHVTVRDIAREAQANVASVNYHFGDKLKLYLSVVQAAIGQVRETIDETTRGAAGLSPEEQLRFYLRTTFMRTLLDDGARTQIQKLFTHEMMEPTPAAELIAARILRPRQEWLCRVVAGIMGLPPDDERVARSVMSIHGQFMLQLSTPLRSFFHQPPRTRQELEAEVEHILEFSLAGIRAIAALHRRGEAGARGEPERPRGKRRA